MQGTLEARFSQEAPPWAMEIRRMKFESVIGSQVTVSAC